MSARQLIVFDLGGVIVRIHRSWADACAALGMDIRLNLADEPWKSRRKPILHEYMTGRLAEGDWVAATVDAIDQHYSPDELHRIHLNWLIEEYEGVSALIDRIHAAGWPTACLSNTNPGHWRLLAPEDGALAEGRPPRFPTVLKLQHRYASHLMGFAKPDPAIYRVFEEQSEYHGSEIVFFDDLEENIEAAREFGWQAVLIDHAGDTAAQIASALEARRLL